MRDPHIQTETVIGTLTGHGLNQAPATAHMNPVYEKNDSTIKTWTGRLEPIADHTFKKDEQYHLEEGRQDCRRYAIIITDASSSSPQFETTTITQYS